MTGATSSVDFDLAWTFTSLFLGKVGIVVDNYAVICSTLWLSSPRLALTYRVIIPFSLQIDAVILDRLSLNFSARFRLLVDLLGLGCALIRLTKAAYLS